MQFEYPDISDCLKKGGLRRIGTVYNQKYEHIGEDVYMDRGKNNHEFDNTHHKYSQTKLPICFAGKGDDEIETIFLENIGKFDVDYAAAVHDTIFKVGANDIWNTNHITSTLNQLCHLHSRKQNEIAHFDGITTPYLYSGISGTSFAIHIEDLALWSCNYNRGPGKKLWYVLPPSWYNVVKDAVESVINDQTCPHPIQHKDIFVKPAFFQARGIPYTRVNSSIPIGFNIAKKVNSRNCNRSFKVRTNLLSSHPKHIIRALICLTAWLMLSISRPRIMRNMPSTTHVIRHVLGSKICMI